MGLNTKCRCPTQYPVASLENHTPISAIRLMLCIFNGTTHFPKLTHTHAHPSTRTHRIHTTCQLANLLLLYGRVLYRTQRCSISTAIGSRELHSPRLLRTAREQASSTWRQLLKCFSSDNILAVSRANSAECL